MTFERAPDLRSHFFQIAGIRGAVGLRRGAHADEDQFTLPDGRGRITADPQAESRNVFPDQSFQSGLIKRAATGLDQRQLVSVHIHADNLVTHFRQTRRGYAAHVTKPENADVHLRLTFTLCRSPGVRGPLNFRLVHGKIYHAGQIRKHRTRLLLRPAAKVQ